MFTHRDFFSENQCFPHQENSLLKYRVFFFLKNQCFHTRKIQRSHTSKLWFPEKINVHTPGFFSEKSMFPHQENSTFTHRDFSPLHPKKSMSSHTEKKFQTKRNAKKSMSSMGEIPLKAGKNFHLWVNFHGFFSGISASNARRKKKRWKLATLFNVADLFKELMGLEKSDFCLVVRKKTRNQFVSPNPPPPSHHISTFEGGV